jgi:hypothetical protein
MSELPEFEKFGKIARLSREIVVTEKIDGTNAQVWIGDDGVVLAGSRSRWLTLEKDNFGFAKWVRENEEELMELGVGRHYGEWWGPGIQRGYGLKDRKFSLFNVSRWGERRPVCCDVVPVLWRGEFSLFEINSTLGLLEKHGSVASPGFMRPEGVVIFHTASGYMFKKTIEGDERPKGKQDE